MNVLMLRSICHQAMLPYVFMRGALPPPFPAVILPTMYPYKGQHGLMICSYRLPILFIIVMYRSSSLVICIIV